MTGTRKVDTSSQKTELGETSARIVVLGAGRVGRALVEVLSRTGHDVLGLWSRSAPEAGSEGAFASGVARWWGPLPSALASADVILVAVRDQAITPVAETLRRSGLVRTDCRVIHLCGARPAGELLAPLGAHSCGTMHPLVAVRSAEQGRALLPSAHWVLEGDDMAVAVCAQMIDELGAPWVRLSSQDLGLYHAAAVIASNHTVALWAASADLLQRLGGIDASRATAMLQPLLRSVAQNVAAFGLEDALTGPVSRGDAATVQRHVQVLSRVAPELVASYVADARLALAVAQRQGSVIGRDLATIAGVLASAGASTAQKE